MLKSCIFRSRNAIRRITHIRFRLPGPETERREAAGRAFEISSADRLDPEDAGRNGTGGRTAAADSRDEPRRPW